jgi:hypothetical protein
LAPFSQQGLRSRECNNSDSDENGKCCGEQQSSQPEK